MTDDPADLLHLQQNLSDAGRTRAVVRVALAVAAVLFSATLALLVWFVFSSAGQANRKVESLQRELDCRSQIGADYEVATGDAVAAALQLDELDSEKVDAIAQFGAAVARSDRDALVVISGRLDQVVANPENQAALERARGAVSRFRDAADRRQRAVELCRDNQAPPTEDQ